MIVIHIVCKELIFLVIDTAEQQAALSSRDQNVVICAALKEKKALSRSPGDRQA
jgi:hypothetical protein